MKTIRFWDVNSQRLKFGYLESVDETKFSAVVVTNEGDLGGTSYKLPWRLIRRVSERIA